jgi:UDP-N-acetylmuramoyl-tripeptide--D-alanyl-D-alanine ligase
LRFDQLAAVTAGTLYNTESAAQLFSGVSIDSRTLNQGELFIAIPGERYDGHDFIPAALQRGAAGVVARSTWPRLNQVPGTVPVVAVENPHQAMLRLAGEYRRSLSTRFIGITGSNGKTTTKEMTHALLGAVTPRAFGSPGNLNNLYGVPLALFRMPEETEAAVLELGISTKEEMPILADLVCPDVAVFTNVGPSHLHNFKTVAGVARAKLELARRAPESSTALVNADDEVLMSEAKSLKREIVTFGLNSARWSPDEVALESEGRTVVVMEGRRFILETPGRHHVYNFLAAYAAVRELGYVFDKIDTESIRFKTAPMRGQIVEHQGIRFVVDCYNANPESVRAGLEAFATIPNEGRRIIVLGDMLELGEESVAWHHRVGELLAEYDFAEVVMVGPRSRRILRGAYEAGVPSGRLHHFRNVETAINRLWNELCEGDLVYLKASRGIGLEAVLEAFANPGGKS